MSDEKIVELFFETLSDKDKEIFINAQRYMELVNMYASFRKELLRAN